ncbi:MAG: hypothetical protein EOO77_10470 [Oxalobacteraceae bacterium]|nr:MAG: hypothetical protein EOO77_10470 [Oxalobacteraceae bacterium]
MPQSSATSTFQPSAPLTFPPAHIAAALSWPAIAGGLVPWTVFVDVVEEDGTEYVTVSPPMADGVGYELVRDAAGVVVTWGFMRRSAHAPDLIAAMQLCCPLAPVDLAGMRHAANAYATLSVIPAS